MKALYRVGEKVEIEFNKEKRVGRVILVKPSGGYEYDYTVASGNDIISCSCRSEGLNLGQGVILGNVLDKEFENYLDGEEISASGEWVDAITGQPVDELTPPLTGARTDNDILDEVKEVLRERNVNHGEAKANFNTIKNLWNNYLGFESLLTEKDVSIMMILLKIARIKDGQPNRDDLIDIIGYATLTDKI